MSSSMGRIIPYMMEKKNVWNHQQAENEIIDSSSMMTILRDTYFQTKPTGWSLY